ncbi:MAG: sugar ABC transporter ATP-binding protein [Acidimicrobiales bacterium]|nr:sugar ABC transporter ATP-binding protein [Acidimicrobiales bacterium]
MTIEHLAKHFPGQIALDDVDLEIAAGQIHALVGQNGSGKSTLIKCLAGYHEPTGDAPATFAPPSGGSAVRFDLAGGAAVDRVGIRFVHQDLALVDGMSAAENLALGSGFTTARMGRIRWSAEVARAEAALSDLGFADFDVRLPVGALTPAQKTAVAIARAVAESDDPAKSNVRLLILDEPTASLPGDDVVRLFTALEQLKARGVAILYVSHHLDEIFRIADVVTVLRDGRRVATKPIAELDHGSLIELMIGREMAAVERPPVSITESSRALVVRGLEGGTVRRLDLDVRAGEIVGVAGITGSGREDVVGLIIGQTPSASGSVSVGGQPVPPYRPRAGIAAGMASLPGDRKRLGIVPLLPVADNITLGNVEGHWRRGRLDRNAELHEAREWVERLSIITAGVLAPIGVLSGGNQQKALFARALRMAPGLLVLDEPTHGIDVGAKADIHELLDHAAADGAAVLVATTDTEELVRLTHRVVVMRGGEAVAELSGADLTVASIEHAQLAPEEAIV